jgi:hypothetical protein
MNCQKSHRIDLDVAVPCKHCGKDTYTEYLCHPKYGRVHTDYHRYCPKCKSCKNTYDGDCLACPQCIAVYSEKYAAKQAQDRAMRIEEEKYNAITAQGVRVVLFLISALIAWSWYCSTYFVNKS